MEIDNLSILVLIVIGLIIIFLLIVNLLSMNRNKNDANKKIQDLKTLQEMTYQMNQRREQENQKQLFEFRLQFEKSLKDDFERLAISMDRRILNIQHQVDQKLDQSFNQTNKTFQNVLERLNRIDFAQKKLDDLAVNINSLEQILDDKTARGAFGEIQLENIFKSIFGDNQSLYKTQYTLPNNRIVDLLLTAPAPMGNVAIDSKFPLENYRRIIEKQGQEQEVAKRGFKQDMRKHIDDIASKYIVEDVTAEYAILFLPAESVFSYIQAYHQDIVTYGYEKKVWLTSPTTLMAMLTTLQTTIKNIERDKYANVIRQELQLLGKEFSRYQDRWYALAKHIDQVSRDVKEVNITSEKISSRFSQIENADFNYLSPDDHILKGE